MATTETFPVAPAEGVARAETPLRRFVSDYCESKVAVGALVVITMIAFVAIFAPLISPQNPYDLGEITILDGRLPPGSKSMTGMTFVLGTDDQGRDMLSAIFYGLRTSLAVGAMSGFIALCLGMSIGPNTGSYR